MSIRKRKGISEAVGFIILILILLTALIPVTVIMLAQPNDQFQQINNAQIYKNVAEQQYNLFQPSPSIMPPVFFIYNKTDNSVEFIISPNATLPSPLIIKYLTVFNGTNWIYLSIVKEGKKIIAKPTNNINSSAGILISPANSNTVFGNYLAIKIYLAIRPYDYESNYVAAVTQYGNIIYPVQGISLPKIITRYIYEGGVQFEGMMQNAFPTIINYYSQYFYGNPFLQLANVYHGIPTDGLVIWSQRYTQGQNLTIAIVGTYTENRFDGGHGFNFYLFMEPFEWNISKMWNSSSAFPAEQAPFVYPGKAQGTWYLPYSSTPYLLVTWDSGWGTFYAPPPNGGMWDVWLIGPHDSYINYQYYSIGEGYFNPRRGDLIIVIVTYDPQTNMLYGIAYDYNTSQYSLLKFSLSILGFKPPKSGVYAFAIGSGNAWLKANWGLLYVNVPTLQNLFNPQLAKYIYYVEAKMQGA